MSQRGGRGRFAVAGSPDGARRGRFSWRQPVVAGLLAAAVAVPAGAADLGRLRLLSAADEPLRAEIELTALTPREADTLAVSLAGQDVYTQAGVAYAPALAGLSLSLGDDAQGRRVVKVASPVPVQVSVLDLLVELTWNKGRFIRQYSFVLNPPAATAQAPETGSGPSLVVEPGDTLTGIAQRIRPPGASLAQTLLALTQANPRQFADGNTHRLRAGAALARPPAEAIAAIDPARADQAYREQTALYTALRDRLAESAAQVERVDDGQERGQQAQGAIDTQPVPVAEPGAATDALRLSAATGAEGAGVEARGRGSEQALRDRLEEERDATRRAIAEAESRLQELQQNVTQMRGLLEAQNEALAGMADRARQDGAQEVAATDAVPAAPAAPDADRADESKTGVAWLIGLLALLAAALAAWAANRRQAKREAAQREQALFGNLGTPLPPLAAAGAVGAAAAAGEDDEYGPLPVEAAVPAETPAPLAPDFDLDLGTPPAADVPADAVPDVPPGSDAPVAPPVLDHDGAGAAEAGRADIAAAAAAAAAAAPDEASQVEAAGSSRADGDEQDAALGVVAAAAASAAEVTEAWQQAVRGEAPAVDATPPTAAGAVPGAVAPASQADAGADETADPWAKDPFGARPAPAAPAPSSLADMLDLEAAPGAAPSFNEKLELARAYVEIGDNDGARELYEEILREGNAEQRRAAREAMAAL